MIIQKNIFIIKHVISVPGTYFYYMSCLCGALSLHNPSFCQLQI